MKRFEVFILFVFVFQNLVRAEEPAYLFSYFTGRGEDGLHLACSYNGLQWEALNKGESVLAPEIGKDKLFRDPCILQGPDGIFHMVWTTGWWDRHIGYASSDDLIHWSEQKIIPVMEQEPEAKNCWAPELFYDEENREFLIFWASTIPGRHSEIAESEREKGLNHRIYFTTTKDFANFAPTRLFFNPDFSVIDATLLKYKQEYVMFLKNENPNPPEKNIRYTLSPKASGPYPTSVSEPITGDYWAEGPTALPIGEYIYLYFDKYRDHRYGTLRTKDLTTWEDVSDKVSFPQGIRHGTAFVVSLPFVDQLRKSFSNP
ncbi:MAG TPA: glycoside hydrolase family 43 protein [Prolixibacteraceae bacterium]|nr:glycoside hydrolase family 43 protein [Prolixibacteraceae bacterium]